MDNMGTRVCRYTWKSIISNGNTWHPYYSGWKSTISWVCPLYPMIINDTTTRTWKSRYNRWKFIIMKVFWSYFLPVISEIQYLHWDLLYWGFTEISIVWSIEKLSSEDQYAAYNIADVTTLMKVKPAKRGQIY